LNRQGARRQIVQKTEAPVKVTPGNGQEKITLDVPEGLSAEQYAKMVGTFTQNREKGQRIARADGKALRALIKTHKPEFQSNRIRFWKEEGLDPSKLKV